MHRRQKPPPLLVFSPPRDTLLLRDRKSRRIFPWFVEPARPRIGCGIRFAVTACALRVCQSSRENIILLIREWIAQRGQASVEARNDDDPSKMKEWCGGARLSFLMSIGSDSLLNAAMISRSGRGRTRPRSLARWFTRSRFDTRGCWSVSLLLLWREESVRHTLECRDRVFARGI